MKWIHAVLLILVTNAVLGTGAYVGYRFRVDALLDKLPPPYWHGPTLVGPYRPAKSCRQVIYEGAGTRLYSNRPYHTRDKVELLVGRRFCQTSRHGTDISLLRVLKPTLLYALGTEKSTLADAGWTRVDTQVFVKGVGVHLNNLYAKRMPPGTYVVNHGYATTTTPLFWNIQDALILH